MTKSGKKLIIIEGPGKIKTMEKFLGDDFMVMASVGHIIDLPKEQMGIDFTKNFTPTYVINKDKVEVVNKLISAYAKSSDIYLASDDDREGEMIAWSIARELKLTNPKRLRYTSVTKAEVLEAIKKPSKIDNNLVEAQKMRRLLDRIVGYKLSPLLWKNLGNPKLSAGRVQSPIVRLIVERDKLIKDFFQKESNSFFKFNAQFFNPKEKSKKIFRSTLYSVKQNKNIIDENEEEAKELNADENEVVESDSESENSDSDSDSGSEGTVKKGYIAKISSATDAKDLMKLMIKSKYKVSSVVTKESVRYPAPPFTTSTMQQEAAKKFGFTPKRTMDAAQRLYEVGHITYMRTDSVNLSNEGMENIGKYILDTYGKKYHSPKQYKTKAQHTQEAHEAVRPTHIETKGIPAEGKITSDAIRLYNLIWKRAVASQMSPAKFDVSTIQIEINKTNDYFYVTQVESMTFPGYLTVYSLKNENTDDVDDEEVLDEADIKIPKKGTTLDVSEMVGQEEYQKPPVRYNDATIVKKLDQLAIVRPATGASFVSKVVDIGYVKKGDIDGVEKDSLILKWDGTSTKMTQTETTLLLGKEKNKYIATDLGKLVTSFLVSNFSDVLDYQFTADMEKKLDGIATGKLKWDKVLKEFYEVFGPLVDKLDKEAANKTFIDENSRKLGKHPTKGFEIIATIGKYGPYVKMIDPKAKKPEAAPIKKPLTIDTITLEDAVKLFEWPKILGKIDKKTVYLYRGQYGLYAKIGNDKMATKVNLSELEDTDPDDITVDDVEKAMKDKTDKDKEKYLWTGQDEKFKYAVLKGQYGNFVNVKLLSKPKEKGVNYSVPADVDFSTLTIEKIQEIVEKGKLAKKNRFTKKGDDTKTGGKKGKTGKAGKKASGDESKKPSKVKNLFLATIKKTGKTGKKAKKAT